MQKKTTIILGSDHAGFNLKESVKKHLDKLGYTYKDVGVFDDKPSDYPKIAFELALKVSSSDSKGILMCGTGIGECIVANKVKGIRAANCFDEYTAKMSREHNDSNILCLGARALSESAAKKIVKVWLETEFSTELRHSRRLKEISEIESRTMK